MSPQYLRPEGDPHRRCAAGGARSCRQRPHLSQHVSPRHASQLAASAAALLALLRPSCRQGAEGGSPSGVWSLWLPGCTTTRTASVRGAGWDAGQPVPGPSGTLAKSVSLGPAPSAPACVALTPPSHRQGPTLLLGRPQPNSPPAAAAAATGRSWPLNARAESHPRLPAVQSPSSAAPAPSSLYY